MPQNGIQHEGIAALAEAFKSNPNLRVCNQQLSFMQGSKFIFALGSTCATRCKFLGALAKF